MSRSRREATWVYVDDELGHVPALPGPEPRARHRHSRAQVRAQRHRGKRRDVRHETITCTCYWCYRNGGVNQQWWRKRHGVRRPAERRLRATGAADTAAALRCDGEDPEPETFDEEEEHDRLCLWLETGQDTVWYETPDTEEQ